MNSRRSFDHGKAASACLDLRLADDKAPSGLVAHGSEDSGMEQKTPKDRLAARAMVHSQTLVRMVQELCQKAQQIARDLLVSVSTFQATRDGDDGICNL